jgi:hypothetical protein
MVVAVATTGCLRLRGLVSATLPVAGYFALLLSTAVWAVEPFETFRWVAIDSIEMVVFMLFFLAGRNSSGSMIALALISILIPTAVMTALTYWMDPLATRFAGYSLALLPMTMAFSAAGAVVSRRKWPWLLAMCAVVAFLLISRSRSPLAAAMLAAVLSVIVFGRNPMDRARKAAAGVAVLAALMILLALLPVTRPLLLTTFVRATRLLPASLEKPFLVLDEAVRETAYGRRIRPRGEISERALIAERSESLARESFPRGIGYMNFQLHFEKVYGFRFALHSMYWSWFLEGGVLVALYVFACGSWLLTRLWRALARSRPREDLAHGWAILIGLAAVLFQGAFHQLHQSPSLWLLLGLAAAELRNARDAAQSTASRSISTSSPSSASFQ